MRINTDRLFFDPYQLALMKGLVYGVAYGTAIALSSGQGVQNYFNLIIFLLGFAGEFFELGFFKENKSHFVIVVSRSVFAGIMAIVVFFFCVAYNYNGIAFNQVINFLDNHFLWVKVIVGILCVWPFATGIYLMAASVPPDSKVSQKSIPSKRIKHGLGYRAMRNKNVGMENK